MEARRSGTVTSANVTDPLEELIPAPLQICLAGFERTKQGLSATQHQRLAQFATRIRNAEGELRSHFQAMCVNAAEYFELGVSQQ